jgi:hypothetical protein
MVVQAEGVETAAALANQDPPPPCAFEYLRSYPSGSISSGPEHCAVTPNLRVTTVIATLVHGTLFGVSMPKVARSQEVPTEAFTAIEEANPQDLRVASGTKSDPASGPSRAPAPTAIDARSFAEQTLITVDVPPAGSAPAANEARDETLLEALNPAEPSQIDPVDPNEAPSPGTRAHEKAQASRGGGGIGGLRSRQKRRPKHEDSIRTPAEPVEIDMGQPGGVDALLYGEGSPGLSHDLSSPPRIGGYVYWECPWPAAAAQANVNHAVVHVTVDVTVRGKATAVHLIDQPGYEFGDDAIRCAMDQRYIPGRDTLGKPVAGRTRKFSVQFSRSGAGGSR